MSGLKAVILFALQFLPVAVLTEIERPSQCIMEEAGLCGWLLGDSVEGSYTIGRGQAQQAPGPLLDAVPGTAEGHYVFVNFTGSLPENPETLLIFPTYRYICEISISYSSSTSLELSVLRFNSDRTLLPPSSSETQWSWWNTSFNISDSDSPIMILIEGVGGGGEAEEEEEEVQVAAVDNITLTFCLPCDFGLLPQSGNLILSVPSFVNMTLGRVTNFPLSVSSPLCPSLPLVINIDAVEPPSLAAIFTIEEAGSAVRVDATGPHLLAQGALGHINVSVYVLGSNYTQTGLPYAATATISFEQDPIIRLHDTPSELSVEVDVPFTLQIHAAHILPSPHSLSFTLHTSPDSLNSHISIDHLGEVTGVVTVDTLTDIIQVGGASITVGLVNEYGSLLEVTIPLVIPPTPPLPLNSDLSFTVAENHSIAMTHQLITTLSLIDPNGDNFSLPFMTWENELFELLPLGIGWKVDGLLLVDQTRLDYETKSFYSLNLTVMDSTNSSLFTSLTINITVTSENEHTPQFIDFRSSVIIQADWTEGSLVTSERATDQDQGPAGQISYYISSGNQRQFFQIDETGDVRVASSPLLPGVYHMIITAIDHGSPPLSTSDDLTVTVTAVGEVDCLSNQAYGKPVIHSIGIDDSHMKVPVGGNVTLYCSYQANPAVALYQWDVNPIYPPSSFSYIYPLSSPSPHISLLPYQLTLVRVTAADAAIYTCNVTNWCGHASAIHILFIIDLPQPVKSLSYQMIERETSPDDENSLYPTSLDLSWLPPSISSTPESPLLDIEATYHLVQVALFTGNPGNSYRDVANVSVSKTNVLIKGLLPGNRYHVRMASVNEAGVTPSDDISVTLPSSTPKLSKVDTKQLLSNSSVLVTWTLAYDGGYPITDFTITISPQSLRTRRQEGGVVYHVDPLAGSLLTGPLESGRRYTVHISLENSVGQQDYSLSEYVGHVETVECDFEPQQLCPWQLEGGASLSHFSSGEYVEAVVYGQSSEVILRHSTAGYSCGYGLSYQLWGGVELQLRVAEGGDVIWEDSGDTGGRWKQVNTSEAEDVDYLTTSLDSQLEMVVTSSGDSGGVRIDLLQLDFCLPCDLSSLQLPGKFALDYQDLVTLHLMKTSNIPISAILTDCSRAVIQVDHIRVVPGVLENYLTPVVDGHNVSLTVSAIPSDISIQTGFLQVSIVVVGSDYASPSSKLVDVAEIELMIEEGEGNSNCSDVISCDFDDDDTCGWSLGEYTSLTETLLYGRGMGLSVSDSHTNGTVMNRGFPDDRYCRLSFSYMIKGVELVAIVSGVGVVWTSGKNRDNSIDDDILVANFTFDLQESGVRMEPWNVTVYLGEVWDEAGSVVVFSPTVYPCTPCPPSSDSLNYCPEPSPTVCPTIETCSTSKRDGYLVGVVGALTAAVAVLLICSLCSLIYCLRRRNVSQKEKRWREADRQRLVSDGDSIGTAGSLSRASAVGDKRRWRKCGESSTLMTFVPDEESASRRGREEASWLQTVELTHTHHQPGTPGAVRGLGTKGGVLLNPLFNDDEDDEEEEEEGESVEMSTIVESDRRRALSQPSLTHSSGF